MTEHEQQIANLERILNIYREREVVWLEMEAKHAAALGRLDELTNTITTYWGCEPRENTACPVCKLLKKWEQS